jgi:hypothetical protein
MYGWDPGEEPTGDSHRRVPPRRSRPREAFDPARGSEYPDTASAGRSTGNRGRPASRFLSSAGRRAGNALVWFAVLVIAPLFLGILLGAVAGKIHL